MYTPTFLLVEVDSYGELVGTKIFGVFPSLEAAVEFAVKRDGGALDNHYAVRKSVLYKSQLTLGSVISSYKTVWDSCEDAMPGAAGESVAPMEAAEQSAMETPQ